MLAVLVILGGSLSVFAQPPRKAQVIGSVFQDNGNVGASGTYDLKIIPVNNNVFGVYSDTTLTACTRVYLYFSTDFESIESFSLQIKVLSSAYSLGTSQNTAYCRLNNVSSSGIVSDSVTLGSNIQLNVDSTNRVFSWVYNGTVTGRSCFLVTITFQTFVLSTTPLYFEMLSLSVNGESTPLTYSDVQLQQINEAINEDVPLPSAVPSLEDIGSDIVNEGIDLAQSWVHYFTTNFDIAGAMSRVVKPFSDYFLVLPNDGNPAHTTLVVIMLFSLGAVLVVWLINKLKRRQDDA